MIHSRMIYGHGHDQCASLRAAGLCKPSANTGQDSVEDEGDNDELLLIAIRKMAAKSEPNLRAAAVR